MEAGNEMGVKNDGMADVLGSSDASGALIMMGNSCSTGLENKNEYGVSWKSTKNSFFKVCPDEEV